ncbi:MAG: hypothetical protein E7Z63_00965 [Thermoplasmata archaeon]|nr:hypothetical protein [Thermoplasmata archaeon]
MCRRCGYEVPTSDIATYATYRKKYPDKDLREIPYICVGCIEGERAILDFAEQSSEKLPVTPQWLDTVLGAVVEATGQETTIDIEPIPTGNILIRRIDHDYLLDTLHENGVDVRDPCGDRIRFQLTSDNHWIDLRDEHGNYLDGGSWTYHAELIALALRLFSVAESIADRFGDEADIDLVGFRPGDEQIIRERWGNDGN